MIIDSHVHISYLKKRGNFLQIRDDLLLNMKKNGINYSIVIPDNLNNSACADAKTVIELIKNQTKLYMVGTLKITEIGKQSLKKIQKMFEEKTIRGFKIFPGHDPVYPNDKRWFPVYTLCQKYNFPLIIHTGININDTKCAKYNDPKYIVKIAKLYPKLKIVIAHYFWPKLDYCFSITNSINNIYFDISGLADPKVANASGGIKKIKEILIKTMERREESVIFGTDWPMCDVKKHINLINFLNITQEKKRKIFYENSLKVFQLLNKR